jgi:putative transposase
MSALGMAISNRKPNDGAVVHSDHGSQGGLNWCSQFTSWAFSDRVKSAGLALSMGRVGDAFDNAMMEAFWGRMQTELLNRRRWRTRLELANSIFEYVEIFHNRKRRHSALGMLTPHEYETLYHQQLAA